MREREREREREYLHLLHLLSNIGKYLFSYTDPFLDLRCTKKLFWLANCVSLFATTLNTQEQTVKVTQSRIRRALGTSFKINIVDIDIPYVFDTKVLTVFITV